MKVKTYVPNATEIEHAWWLVDADGQTLGRLATQVARLLQGKHRPGYTPHLDLGDHVVVVNAEKLSWTGQRGQQKSYYSHSGYPGGLRETSLQQMMTRHPERVVRLAVRGMLPRTKLGRHMLKKLKIYAGAEHPHEAQSPKPFGLIKRSN